MAIKQSANTTAQRAVTGADILALLNRNDSASDSSFSDAAVDYTANAVNDLSTGLVRLSSALSVGARNAVKHFALERAVQINRSDAKLAAAAERAAARINAFNATL